MIEPAKALALGASTMNLMTGRNLLNTLPEDVLVTLLCYVSVAEIFALKQVGKRVVLSRRMKCSDSLRLYSPIDSLTT